MLSFPAFQFAVRNSFISTFYHCKSPRYVGNKLVIPSRLSSSRHRPRTQNAPHLLNKYIKKTNRPTAKVWPDMTVRDLARALDVDPDYLFHLLLQTDYADIFERYEDSIQDRNLIARLVNLAGFRSEFIHSPYESSETKTREDKDVFRRPAADPSICLPRPPVVTIMGHVDHGKTTLLDYLRRSQIAAQEFGGITQHIGAFVVKLPHTGAKITFLDTPGHAAFKSMRARGARVTDIVVLVVAADDGVMEQTLESIRFAREARVPMVVAISKCDKHNANLKKAKADLLAQNIQLEEYGGDVQAICVSALQGTNMIALQEAIIAQAELMNLKADFKGLVEGSVIEAKTVHGKGGVCTVLVQRGTLKKGAFLVAGEAWCRVRALYDEFGKLVTEATPSIPVEVTGWKDDLPSAGDEILEVETENKAREVIAWRKKKAVEAKMEADKPLIERQRKEAREKYEDARKARLEAFSIKGGSKLRKPLEQQPEAEQETVPHFNVIIKGDVDGSVEAILEVFETYNSAKCTFDLVSFGIGPVTENDLEMATISKATIYCFNVSNPPSIEKKAVEQQLAIKHFNVIYKLVDDWKNELSNLLPHADKENVVGEGTVVQEFLVTDRNKKVPVAGCRVTKGVVAKKQRIRFIRDGEVIFDGAIASMKKEKQISTTANVNEEVGIIIEDANVRFLPNDIVQCYETSKVPQKIDWSPPGF